MLKFHELKLNTEQPVYIQLALYVKRQILIGNANSGDRLPSRREIALQLGINPNTVQKAFRLMEQEGYVHTSGNQGSVLYLDEVMMKRIEQELTSQMMNEFIYAAKEINLSFKQVIELISEAWDRD